MSEGKIACVGTRAWVLWRAVGTAYYVESALEELPPSGPRSEQSSWMLLKVSSGPLLEHPLVLSEQSSGPLVQIFTSTKCHCSKTNSFASPRECRAINVGRIEGHDGEGDIRRLRQRRHWGTVSTTLLCLKLIIRFGGLPASRDFRQEVAAAFRAKS